MSREDLVASIVSNSTCHTSSIAAGIEEAEFLGSTYPQGIKYSPSVDQLCALFGGPNWTFMDLDGTSSVRLPLASFNHIAREVLSLEKSRVFYVEILGFRETVRPPFDCEGYWLWGYGLSLHLVMTSCPEERKEIKRNRIKHFTKSLPRVDHIAFVTNDLQAIKSNLDKHKVFYKEECPKDTGIRQIFFFDPDGNVIEVSNCAPPIGQMRCPETPADQDHHPIQDQDYKPDNHTLAIVSYDPEDMELSTYIDPFNAHDHVHHSHDIDDSTYSD